MQNFKIIFLIIAISIVGCKNQKIPSKPEPVVKTEAVPKVVKPVGKVPSKEERFSAAQGETMSWGSNRYFVIVGSFSVIDNARNFKETLVKENFNPTILLIDSGLYRVCVNSYAEETVARARIAEIREKFSKYNDVWLLIKIQ